jgi:hypothetical protein
VKKSGRSKKECHGEDMKNKGRENRTIYTYNILYTYNIYIVEKFIKQVEIL